MARPLKVYIAASWPNRFRLRAVRDQLDELNIKVTSRWIDHNHEYTLDMVEAQTDYRDIDKADFLIIDTTDTSTRGGREWEGGYATGRGKRVVRVGPVLTPFHARTNLGFATWTDLFTYFANALEYTDVRDN